MLAGVVMAASLAAPLAPAAHAGADEWVVIAEFTAPAPMIDVMGTTLNEAYAAIAAATGAAPKSCLPTTTNYPDRLSGQALLNLTTGQIAYRWFGPGHAFATKNCASGVSISVTVTDVAAAGSPTRIKGSAATARNNDNTTKAWGAKATTSKPEVVYYDGAYMRGNSVVSISVAASYTDKVTGKSIPMSCHESSTQVTPTPDGPFFGTVTSGPCGHSTP
jgi:hypothetical protein